MAKTETRSLKLKIVAVGDKVLKQAAKNLQKISKQTKSIKRDVGGLRNVFLAAFAGVGIKSITNMADSMQLLRDRVGVFTGSAEKTKETMDLLAAAADSTNASIDSLGTVYNRIALATGELGLTTKELIGFTTTLQNTFRLSGATAAEAAGSAIQLSQGLASGQLRGQELRSVLEANVEIGGILAKQLKTTRGNLLKFAEAGTLTSEVVLKALATASIEVSKRAGQLGQTFEQTLVKATNKLKIKIDELNSKYKLNELFATGVSFAIENMGQIMTTVAIVTLPLLAGAFVKMATAAGGAIGKLNIVFTALAGLNALNAFIESRNADLSRLSESEIETKIKNSNKNLKIMKEQMESIGKIKDSGGFFESFKNFFKSGKLKQNEEQIKGVTEEVRLLKEELAGRGKDKKTVKKKSAIEIALDAFSKANFKGRVKDTTVSIKSLNAEFKKTGDAIAYGKALNALQTDKLNKDFDTGKKTLEQYNKELEVLQTQLSKLDGSFNPIQAGAKKALDGIKSLGTEVADAIGKSFGTLEDQLFNFVKTGKLSFADFAQSVLDDLTRIAIRQAVISPIAGAIFGGGNPVAASSSSGGSSSITPKAQGGIMHHGDFTAFAKGGIVNQPTYFPTKSGTGLMGEAGAEAIVPLKRTSNGDLGVNAIPSNVIVNVNNNANVDVGVEESSVNGTRTLDVTITRVVKNAINEGKFDRSFSSSFGVNRKGSK